MKSNEIERLSLEDALAMIDRDFAEGKDKVTLSKATCRAIYYVIWDALHEGAIRDLDAENRHRLDLALSRFGSIGWATGDPADA